MSFSLHDRINLTTSSFNDGNARWMAGIALIIWTLEEKNIKYEQNKIYILNHSLLS